jgi:hypothetical protein
MLPHVPNFDLTSSPPSSPLTPGIVLCRACARSQRPGRPVQSLRAFSRGGTSVNKCACNYNMYIYIFILYYIIYYNIWHQYIYIQIMYVYIYIIYIYIIVYVSITAFFELAFAQKMVSCGMMLESQRCLVRAVECWMLIPIGDTESACGSHIVIIVHVCSWSKHVGKCHFWTGFMSDLLLSMLLIDMI